MPYSAGESVRERQRERERECVCVHAIRHCKVERRLLAMREGRESTRRGERTTEIVKNREGSRVTLLGAAASALSRASEQKREGAHVRASEEEGGPERECVWERERGKAKERVGVRVCAHDQREQERERRERERARTREREGERREERWVWGRGGALGGVESERKREIE